MEQQESATNAPGRPDLNGVWEDYSTSLRAFLRSRVRDQDDAEDLLQDILVKTHKNLGALQNSASLKSWLFQIANTTIIDFYRKQSRAKSVHPDDTWYTDLGASDRHILEGCLSPFIKALPSPAAELLRRVDLEGDSQKQLAAQMGVSYSTLKSRVQAARGQLRDLFEACCDFAVDGQGRVIDYTQRKRGCTSC